MKLKFLSLTIIVLLFGSCRSSNWLNRGLGDPLMPTTVNIKSLTSVNPIKNDYGGGRGSNHLVVYTDDYGLFTGTNEWGTEAIVHDGIVISIGDNNSAIPKNGFVISGNESASVWINKNLKVGMQASLNSDSQLEYVATENTDLEHARAIFIEARDRITEKKELKDHIQNLKITEDKIKAHFSYFHKAKSNKDAVGAKNEATKILDLSTDLYYQSFVSKEKEFRGAWIRLSDKTPEQLINTIQRIADVGINTILPETIYDGYTIYPNGNNKLMPQLPQFEGWDPMAVLIEECEKHKIDVIPWTEMFFVGGANSPIVKQKPQWVGLFRHGSHAAELEEGFHYLCPSRPEVHQFLLESLDTLASRYPTKGIQLDYIRYSLSEPWEKGFCYCDFCKDKVEKELDFDIHEITPKDTAEWYAWNRFRSNNITQFVKSVSTLFKTKYPHIALSADVFPNSQISLKEKFQDWKLWIEKEYLDEVYIMSYSTQNSVIEADSELLMRNVKNTKVRPIVGLGPYIGFQPEVLLQQIEIAQNAGAYGVCLFSFHSLSDEQIRALKLGPFSNRK